ncbi:MAG: polyprenyl synthetase family protein [Bacteroidales bacterium]|jgi:octaprenyl-diphosphate synthase|nr:polyprenyl synthetase family protein [Bacteroidales bacterium]
MTENLYSVTNCINQELNDFEQRIESCFSKESSLLRTMIDYWFAKKGKRIRPALTLLTSCMLGKPSESTYKGSLILELIHTASLIHDDVLDQSHLRRGQSTINNLWGNNAAILLGDYLYGKCMEFVVTQEDFALVPIYSHIATSLPKGELLQKSVAENGSYDEKDYFDIIYYKTATLLEAACEIGVKTCGNTKSLQRMKDAGKYIGIAFQIKDDILDFQLDNNSDKPRGNDLKEKKITLPTIFYLQQLKENERHAALAFILSNEKTDNDLHTFIQKVHLSRSIQKAQEVAEDYSRQALDLVMREQENEYRNQLLQLIKYLTNRQF